MARPHTIIRIDAAYRAMMLRLFHRRLNIIFVNEYPKSGGSWLAQLLSAATRYPFPRQKFPPFGKAIYHGHRVSSWLSGPVVVVWRDPRDIMVSWYFHTLCQSDRNHPQFVKRYRDALGFKDFDDIQANLPRFIEFNFRTPLSPAFSFNDFYDRWYGVQQAIHCRYEDLLESPAGTLRDVAGQLGFDLEPALCEKIADQFSFKAQANRLPGDEKTSSYLRKGIQGDWKNYFGDESVEVMSGHLGERLKNLGYVE